MKKVVIGLILSFCICGIFAQSPKNVTQIQTKANQLTDTYYPELEKLYLHLHQNPEISFQEKNTSAKLASGLKALGYEVTSNIGGYGVVAVLKNGKGPTVMIRADMDALPLEEKTGLDYASKATTTDGDGHTVSTMHACGHDIHMSVLMGTAYNLMQLKSEWKGTLMLVCQPAEERSGGAIAMLKEGLFEKFPKPDYALSLHCNADMPAGKVGYKSGPALANVDMLDITIYGVGGHGAYPHTTIDPVVIGARLVMDLQTIVSREISPFEPAVVTVGSFHSGTKHNIISDEAVLQLTLRSYSDEVREQTIKAIERMAKHVALSAGVPEDKLPKLKLRQEYTPVTINHPELTQRLKKTAENTIGKENVTDAEPSMAGEDFGRYGRTEDKIPICMFWLGTVAPDKYEASLKSGEQLPSLHSPYFAPLPAPSIKTGVKTMTANALDLFLGK